MTGWHVDGETLRRYVERTDSVAEGASVEQHLLTCAQCRARVNAASTAVDFAVVDFPDPTNFSLGKLYTTRFYRLLKGSLTPDAAVSVQCTSPLFARNSYWCIVKTIEAAGFSVKPYQTAVPSFGVWGFALARLTPFDPPGRAPAGLRFLDDQAMAALFVLPSDLSAVPVEINRLDNQALVRYYESEWKRYE